MPKKLTVETTRVAWRVESADLELLHVLFPGAVNTEVRRIVHLVCERYRARLEGRGEAGDGSGPHVHESVIS